MHKRLRSTDSLLKIGHAPNWVYCRNGSEPIAYVLDMMQKKCVTLTGRTERVQTTEREGLFVHKAFKIRMYGIGRCDSLRVRLRAEYSNVRYSCTRDFAWTVFPDKSRSHHQYRVQQSCLTDHWKWRIRQQNNQSAKRWE